MTAYRAEFFTLEDVERLKGFCRIKEDSAVFVLITLPCTAGFYV
ncbi:Uncharacterised protein [Providencia rustigianii]|nr:MULTISPECIES: hypothetical protein [Providencia]VEB70934.1 Uncharacterised protein [Providencia rustigianii]